MKRPAVIADFSNVVNGPARVDGHSTVFAAQAWWPNPYPSYGTIVQCGRPRPLSDRGWRSLGNQLSLGNGQLPVEKAGEERMVRRDGCQKCLTRLMTLRGRGSHSFGSEQQRYGH